MVTTLGHRTMRAVAPRRAGRMAWKRRSLWSFSRVRFDRVIKFKLCMDRVCWICSGLGEVGKGKRAGALSPAGLVCDSSVITLPRGTRSQPMGMPIAGFRRPFLVTADDHHRPIVMWSLSFITEKWVCLFVLSVTDKHSTAQNLLLLVYNWGKIRVYLHLNKLILFFIYLHGIDSTY